MEILSSCEKELLGGPCPILVGHGRTALLGEDQCPLLLGWGLLIHGEVMITSQGPNFISRQSTKYFFSPKMGTSQEGRLEAKSEGLQLGFHYILITVPFFHRKSLKKLYLPLFSCHTDTWKVLWIFLHAFNDYVTSFGYLRGWQLGICPSQENHDSISGNSFMLSLWPSCVPKPVGPTFIVRRWPMKLGNKAALSGLCYNLGS